MCRSVNPAPFQDRISDSGIPAGLIPISPAALISVSIAASFSNLLRNQRVIPPVRSLTSSIEYPLRKASITAPILLSVGILSQSSRSAVGSFSDALSSIVSPSEASDIVSGRGWGFPYSRLAQAFRQASSKERPIAITSPVDFIEVPIFLSAVRNLSNGQRGILTTQ